MMNSTLTIQPTHNGKTENYIRLEKNDKVNKIKKIIAASV